MLKKYELQILSALAVFFVSVFFFGFTSQRTAQTQTVNRPNIVFILGDDLDWKMDSINYMPKLEQNIVSQGKFFDNYFVNYASCCPSRSTILTGKYQHNTNVFGNVYPDGGFKKFFVTGQENSTIATWLHDAGYKTGFAGKYLNNYPDTDPAYIPPGWDDWHAFAGYTSNTDAFYFNYYTNDNGVTNFHGATASDYSTDVISSNAVNFINQRASDTQPFFLYVAPYAPHSPARPAPRYKNYPAKQVPRRDDFNEADVSDKPSWVKNIPLMTLSQQAAADKLYAKKVRSLQALDDLIQNVVNALQASGKLDSTYIFFASDNGFHIGQHRLASGKETPYETDIHLPLVVRGPGIAAGTRSSQLVGNIDFAPTFAELAGLTAPSTIDGRSYAGFLSSSFNQPSTWRNSLLVSRLSNSSDTTTKTSDQVMKTDIELSMDLQDQESMQSTTTTTSRLKAGKSGLYLGVRTLNYKLVHYLGSNEWEFYNLSTDPLELNNTYSSADPTLINSLKNILNSLSTCSGDSCKNAENTPLP